MQTFKTSKAKENILARIRKGLGEAKLPMPFPDAEKNATPVYGTPGMSVEEDFVMAFKELGGKFIFCDSEEDLLAQLTVLHANKDWKQLLCTDERLLTLCRRSGLDIVSPADPSIEGADACITGCEALIGRTGSILLSSAQHMGRTSPVYYPIHIVFAYLDQVHHDIADGLKALKKKYGADLPSMINIATGPSRTADIEKTLVVGVHGPAEVYCFLINGFMP
ncbi:lactate utilization protein [Nemorincola caseinilytica]|uniref:Lactate utilization protein n=1 Tax=Nemorincola caseinilytica TaxID=2054315 RepID=A0ABP8NR47_9BACT